jgi:large subunit ribosomal protein L6
MSRIGKKPVLIPEGVSLQIEGDILVVSGKLGVARLKIPAGVKVQLKENLISIGREHEDRQSIMNQGTFRQLLANLIKGVVEGWQKKLEVKGTGFRAEKQGEDLALTVGFSHQVKISPPAGIKFEVRENKITVTGFDKALVGQTADKIHKIRLPDPYKGKGIKYLDEQLIFKPGKTAKVGVTGAVGGSK